MDFVKSQFEKMQHFHLHKKVPVVMNHNIWKKSYVMIHYYRYLFVKMKVFNYSELHFFEGTFYKIHTLAPFNFWLLISNYLSYFCFRRPSETSVRKLEQIFLPNLVNWRYWWIFFFLTVGSNNFQKKYLSL